MVDNHLISFRTHRLIKNGTALRRFDYFSEMESLFRISFAGKYFVFVYFVH